VQTSAVLFEKEPRRDVRYAPVEVPQLGPEDVLVRSKVVGVCRSDIELLEGHLDAQLGVPYPVVPGHEWSGEVVEVGAAVTNVKPGDPVVGECVIAPNHWFGFTYNGAAAEMFVAPSSLLHRLPESLTYEQGALVEPFTIAYRAIRDSGWLDAADVVAIVGAGMIGQCALSVARAMGAVTVVVEPNTNRAGLAERMGADVVINPAGQEDLGKAVQRTTGSDGADLVIEASGNAKGLASTLELARFAGRITNIGICADRSVSAPLGLIQAKDLSVRGTTGSPGVWPQALRFVERHEIDLSPVVTQTLTFERAAEALRAANDTETNVKVHIRPVDSAVGNGAGG
jgi:L-iditol 2-dehydrogenase